jgi:hypothetical protein
VIGLVERSKQYAASVKILRCAASPTGDVQRLSVADMVTSTVVTAHAGELLATLRSRFTRAIIHPTLAWYARREAVKLVDELKRV